jgi:hypothetical protein
MVRVALFKGADNAGTWRITWFLLAAIFSLPGQLSIAGRQPQLSPVPVEEVTAGKRKGKLQAGMRG